ncbi:aromatic amino acid aminotransferase [Halobacteriales archaeon QS_4_69_31]|nr:MAG: aromatic amino acid aminotransferase [Halobacteriales archaeon QS_4_69_31]
MTFEESERLHSVPPSGIRRYFELAEEQDDIISLGVGEPDFAPPWSARDAAISSLERGQTSYTPNRGLRELRERIATDARERYDLAYDPDDEVLVTAGASEALDLAFRAFHDPGDTVAVAQPCYLSYVPGATLAGADVRDVPTREADDFTLTRDVLEAAGAGAADTLVLCYPNNPTGATMTRAELEPVAAFAREHDMQVFADEVYAALTYEHNHTSIATLEGMRERTVVFSGFSKAYAMTGLRLGYALAPAAAIESMNRIHQYTMLSAPTTAQHAAIEALDNCADDVAGMREAYDRRRQFVLSRFAEMGIDCFPASGAFYVFPECPWANSDAFAEALIEEQSVAVVPGHVFGAGGDGHLRVTYATSLANLKKALNRIETFID